MTDQDSTFIHTTDGASSLGFIPSQTVLTMNTRNGMGYAACLITTQCNAQPSDTCILIPASGKSSSGFCTVHNWLQNDSLNGDGIILTEPGQTALMQTADCLSIWIWDKENQRGVLLHMGRPAGAATPSIITNGLAALAPNPAKCEVLLGGAICGQHFPNEEGVAAEEAMVYLNTYGKDVFTCTASLRLNLRAAAQKVLVDSGIPEKNIRRFGPACTFADENSTSHRRHITRKQGRRTHANTTIVGIANT